MENELKCLIYKSNKIKPDQKKEYGFMKSQLKILNITNEREWMKLYKEAYNFYKKEYSKAETLDVNKLVDNIFDYINSRLSRKYKEHEILIKEYNNKIETIENDILITELNDHFSLHRFILHKKGYNKDYMAVLDKATCEELFELSKNIMNSVDDNEKYNENDGDDKLSIKQKWTNIYNTFDKILKEVDFENQDVVYLYDCMF